MKPGLYIPR